MTPTKPVTVSAGHIDHVLIAIQVEIRYLSLVRIRDET